MSKGCAGLCLEPGAPGNRDGVTTRIRRGLGTGAAAIAIASIAAGCGFLPPTIDSPQQARQFYADYVNNAWSKSIYADTREHYCASMQAGNDGIRDLHGSLILSLPDDVEQRLRIHLTIEDMHVLTAREYAPYCGVSPPSEAEIRAILRG